MLRILLITNVRENSVNASTSTYKWKNDFVEEACMGKKKELKLESLFGSIFTSRLERCVTNAPFIVLIKALVAVRQLIHQEI